MTLRHLRIFIEVARTGKMSTAAANCFISQPTVSQAIRELEEYYHVLLFERLSKKLFITQEGQTLLAYAQRTLEQYRLLEEAMDSVGTKTNLRIGATITIGTCLLSGIINALKQRFEALSTYTYVGNTKVIEEKLLKAELDVGIVEGTIESPDLICEPIAGDFLVLAAAPDHPLAARSCITVENLRDQDFVIREFGSGTRKLFYDYMNHLKIPFHIACEAGCPEAIKRAVLYNHCLTVISVRLLEDEIKDQSIRIFLNKENAWNRSFYLVYHKDKFVTEPMRQLKDIMKAYEKPYFPENQSYGMVSSHISHGNTGPDRAV